MVRQVMKPKASKGEGSKKEKSGKDGLSKAPGKTMPQMSGRALVGDGHPASNASGFGHGSAQCDGPLRMSGVKGAHRVGCK